jgi:hypothetical protein
MQSNRFEGHVIAGAILIGLGVLLLLGNIFQPFHLLSWLWPFLVIVPGVLMFIPVTSGQRDAAGLAVPASLVTGTGLILLYQSVTGNWKSWAYVWTLYGVFLGFGLWLTGRTRREAGARRLGITFMQVGLIGFLLFGSFFEVLIFGGGFGVGRCFWPLVLIGLGLWFFFRAMGGRLPVSVTRMPTAPIPPSAETTAPTEESEEIAAEVEVEIQEAADIAQAMIGGAEPEDVSTAPTGEAEEEDQPEGNPAQSN